MVYCEFILHKQCEILRKTCVFNDIIIAAFIVKKHAYCWLDRVVNVYYAYCNKNYFITNIYVYVYVCITNLFCFFLFY